MKKTGSGQGSPGVGEEGVVPDARGFQRALIRWFRQVGKAYPWRQTRDPYAILVSEMMLQQTRVKTVLERGYYHRWMEKFPDWKTLAAANEAEVFKVWEGLGYYQRARRLLEIARLVEHELGGRFPRDEEGVLALPGIGRYTAGAVLSFAFGQAAPIVDGNVVRVLTRVMGLALPVDQPATMKRLWEIAAGLTPSREAREYNSGIMELGQSVCTKAAPLCLLCPVSAWCRAREENTTEWIPVKAKAREVVRMEERVALLVRGGAVYLCRESGSRRQGLWRLPEVPQGVSLEGREAFSLEYSITKYRVTLFVYVWPEEADADWGDGKGEFFPLDAPENLPPLGAPYKKALGRYLRGQGG